MQMKVTVSQALYSYWNDLRGTRLAPKRFEIEPSRIAGFLPDTFILELIDRETLRFRLAGTRICEAFGTELRGMNLFELLAEADRPTLQRQISLVTSYGAVGVFEISASNGKGLSAAFEVLLMPLTHLRDRVDRFLGSIAPIDKPNWLGSVPLDHRTLEGHYLVWPDGRPHAVVDATHRQIPLLPTVREARIVKAHRRQFRVYEGGLSRLGDEH